MNITSLNDREYALRLIAQDAYESTYGSEI